MKILNARDWIFGEGTNFKKIIWVCKSHDFVPSKFKEIDNHEIMVGIPSNIEELPSDSLVVFDDLMLDLSKNKSLCELCTVYSRHKRISLILLLQNIFHQGQFFRDMSLQTEYFLLLKNPRDLKQFSRIAQQISPQNWRELEKVYIKTTETPYGYILLDVSPSARDAFRFKTDIFNPNAFTCFLSLDDVKKHCKTISSTEEEPVLVADSY